MINKHWTACSPGTRQRAVLTGMAVALAVFMTSTAPALSQTAKTKASAGRLGMQFDPTVKALSSPSGEISVPTTKQLPPTGADAIRFTLKGITFVGAKAVSSGQLMSMFQGDVGKKISLLKVYSYAERVSAVYRQRGYVLSRGLVPAQKINGGKVKINVVEGYIDAVKIDPVSEGYFGMAPQSHSMLETMADKIKASRPLRQDVLERYLLLMNDMSGLTATSVMKPSKANHGASTMTIKLTLKPVDAFASVDNRGTVFVGQEQGTLGFTLNSLAGAGESLGFTYSKSQDEKELVFGRFAFSMPVWPSEGTKISADFSFSKSEPGDTLEDLEIKSKSRGWSATFSHPFIRSREQNLSGRFGFAHKDAESTFLGGLDLSKDETSTVNVGFTYDLVDSLRGVSLISADVISGLSGTDKFNEVVSRRDGSAEFNKVVMTVSRNQSLFPGLSLMGLVKGQMTNDQMLSSQEFGFGGAQMGRGYDASEITGDEGVGGLLELRYGASTGWDFFKDYQLYGSYDIGMVRNKGADDVVDEQNKETAASAAIGTRLNLHNNLSASVEWAKTLTNTLGANADKDDQRIFFSITARY